MRSPLTVFILFLCLFSLCVNAQSRKDLEKLVSKTDTNELAYSVSEITVRGFDGANPPPRMKTPTRKLLYGYGMTAYIIGFDSITFFDIVSITAVHKDDEGNEIRAFEIQGGRYPKEFKHYFVEKCTESQRARIYFENIYLRDKSGNYLKIETEQRLCPHCVP